MVFSQLVIGGWLLMNLVDGPFPVETQITFGDHNHILTNINCWSADGKYILFDTRSDLAGGTFDGSTIARVLVASGKVEALFVSKNGSHCGVVTAHPILDRCVFIHGPEFPEKDHFTYGVARRNGVIVNAKGESEVMEARDLVFPFTPGALRGGSHVHVWHPKGDWISFTYEDHYLAERFKESGIPNSRVVGVSVPGPVNPVHKHPRNLSGSHFSVVVTPIAQKPRAGSDDLIRACEEVWIGIEGYIRLDGSRQKRALAFQGTVLSRKGQPLVEVFVCDLPDDLTKPGGGPLQGSVDQLPFPPAGVNVRRITHTEGRKYPGIQGPRHWLRTSADGSKIAYLAKDDAGIVQLWLVPSTGGEPKQLTHNATDIASAFTWTPQSGHICHAMDGSVCITSVATGTTKRLTQPDLKRPVRPEACVVSPDGKWVAYTRTIAGKNQIFSLALNPN